MSVERRREIVEVCRRHDVTIVEDDVYALMPDELLPPLATMAPERTVYVTGLSKLFGPGLRIGFIVAPSQFSYSMGVALRATTLMASPLNADTACRILASGSLPSIVSAIRNETRNRIGVFAWFHLCNASRRILLRPSNAGDLDRGSVRASGRGDRRARNTICDVRDNAFSDRRDG
jgi:hypothetical protein